MADPALPPGFTEDAPPAAAAPPLPAGFTLDEPQAAAATPAPTQTATGAVQATGSGLTAGAVDVAGMGVDALRNVKELGKAALGFTYHEATGNPIPDALQPEDPADYQKDIGSSDWIKDQVRTLGGSDMVDAQEKTNLNKYLHAGAEGVVPGIVGGPATAVRSGAAGAAASAVQQGVADTGGGALTQAATGIIAGHVAGNLGLHSTTELPPRSQVTPPAEAGGFTPESLQAEGAARRAAATAPAAEATAPLPKAAPAPAPGHPLAPVTNAAPRQPTSDAGESEIARDLGEAQADDASYEGFNGERPTAPPVAAAHIESVPPGTTDPFYTLPTHTPAGPVDIHEPGGQPFSVISAERSERSAEDNATHTQQLGDQLRASGLPHQPTAGKYQGATEPSYAVQTPTAGAQAQVDALAAQHGQESVLHVDSDRNGVYKYLNDGHEEPQGKWASATPEEAATVPGFTQDEIGQHYVLKPAPAPTPLTGLPQQPIDIPGHGTVTPGPSEKIRQVARDYMQSTGRPYTPPTDYRSVVPDQMKGIADAYQAMPHNPNDPAVRASYDALTRETMQQYQAAKDAGLKLDFIKPGQTDPYAASPRLAIEDLRNNNHMWIYPTDAGFGSSGSNVANHPLLKNSGEMISGQPAKVNDIFRAVHDYFGHGAEGNGFRADGEYNAWRQHNAMYSDAAKPALASETLGQNAVVNFGPHGEANRRASSANTVYADQKAGLMPEQVWRGAAGDHEPASGGVPPNPADWVSGPPKLSQMVSFKKPTDEGSASAQVTPQEQAQREATFRALPGLEEVRQSAISGDTKSAGTDFQTSKLDNSGGRRMAQVIGNERAALRSGADDLVAKSGGTDGLEQGDLYRRGASITAPIDTYRQYLDDAIQRIYQTATDRLGGKPMPALTETQNYMKSNKSDFLGTVEGKQLLEGVNARMKELGFVGDNDTFNPPTVEQAERFRQYLSDQWTPRTGRMISALKQSLDNDVAKSAGEDVYAQARMVNTLRNKMIDEPKGVSKMLAPDDRLGINRDVPLENIPKFVTGLPVDQFGHVVNVLKQAGMTENTPELTRQAANSLNEIRSQFMNEYRAAGNTTDGMWNAKASNNYLLNNQARLAMVFSPQELQQIKVHNDAATYLRMDRSYPGAAAQGHNLAVRGALGLIQHGAGAAGALMGEIPGALAGAALGKGAEALGGAALKRSIEGRIKNLSGTAQKAPGGGGGGAGDVSGALATQKILTGKEAVVPGAINLQGSPDTGQQPDNG